ncbi:hypothetical protein [Xanthomonas arboricola]|uniref:hypothetical protein n=1 Tax=Xanthomonas arboricola TaxID=56448 RepID=UPI000C868D66|nr:hypothetical protein [Xanthomonas arboricola]PMR89099.1 hypothetical protein C1H21_08570 [Xanthomonas arboricola pv. juglandis]
MSDRRDQAKSQVHSQRHELFRGSLTPQADHVVTARKVMESIVETSSPEKNAKIKNERILTLSAAMCVMQWKVDNEA